MFDDNDFGSNSPNIKETVEELIYSNIESLEKMVEQTTKLINNMNDFDENFKKSLESNTKQLNQNLTEISSVKILFDEILDESIKEFGYRADRKIKFINFNFYLNISILSILSIILILMIKINFYN